MKTNAIIRIALYSLAIIILSCILLGSFAMNYYFEDGRLISYEMTTPLPTESPNEITASGHSRSAICRSVCHSP